MRIAGSGRLKQFGDGAFEPLRTIESSWCSHSQVRKPPGASCRSRSVGSRWRPAHLLARRTHAEQWL